MKIETLVPEGQQAPNAWRVLFVLLLANLLNVYDRMIPAVLAEPMRIEFGLSDTQLGLIGTAFTIVYAISGLPIGRLADIAPRKYVMGAGLVIWSGMTALSGLAGGYISFLLIRMGVGVGEASYAPAAHSLISDLFPPRKRSTAVGIFTLGIPLGLILGFGTVGAIASALGSWRAAFFVAAIPGFLLAVVVLMMREPKRGASEVHESHPQVRVTNPVRTVLRGKTMWWLIMSGLGATFATYAGTSFMMPLLQRYYHVDLKSASLLTGLLVGVSGLIALTTMGAVADRMQRRWPTGRLHLCTAAMALAAALTFAALLTDNIQGFAILFGVGWIALNVQPVCIYPAVQEIVAPQLRATAIAVFLAAMYLLGAAFGTVAVGALSDYFAEAARLASNAAVLEEIHRAHGLHSAMYLIPASLMVAAISSWMASRNFVLDMQKNTTL